MLLSRPAYAPRGPVRLLLVMPSLMLLVCGCFSGTDETPSSRSRTAPVQDEGTRRMVVALQQIYEEAVQNPRPYFHLNHLRAEGLRRTVDTLSGPDQEAMRFYYAGELLNAGESNATIRELNRVIKTMKFSADEITRDSKPVYEMLALANLRLGEQQNCLEQHAAQACILPLIDGGIHSRQRGSRRAITIYSRLLEHFPDDYQSRWLLNVAYMTLGEYPEGVPAPWRIEGIEARARPLLPRFPNIAVELGIDVDEISGGVSVDDFNNDGLLDLFVTSYGLNDAARLFLSDSTGGFVDHTEAAGLTGISSGLNVVHADYNNDGFVDIFILRGAWLQITWPNRQRTVETHTDVPIRRSVRIVEGQAPVVLNRPPVAWRAQEPHRHH